MLNRTFYKPIKSHWAVITPVRKVAIGKLLAGIGILLLPACSEMLEVTPVGQYTNDIAFADSSNAEAAVAGLYAAMRGSVTYYLGGTTYRLFFFDRLQSMSDELQYNGSGSEEVGLNTNIVLPGNVYVRDIWREHYNIIYNANDIIANVAQTSRLSQGKRNQLVGEAKFIRAFCYFVLTQLWGDVPLITTTEYLTNNTKPREAREAVLEFITRELEESETLLPVEYSHNVVGHRTRVAQPVAKALLARVYLYRQDWQNAQSKATEVINNSLFLLPEDLEEVVEANSGESIWELWAGPDNSNLLYRFLPENASAVPLYTPTRQLIHAFEPGDKRKASFLNFIINPAGDTTWFAYKYRDNQNLGVGDQPKMLRLAEQYFIRAEAYAQQNKLMEAATDLNVIRNRAGLPNAAAIAQQDLLQAIERERMVELCFEGHRWFDLVRTNRADPILGVFKPQSWRQNAILLPVPAQEVANNPNLLPQNPGF